MRSLRGAHLNHQGIFCMSATVKKVAFVAVVAIVAVKLFEKAQMAYQSAAATA